MFSILQQGCSIFKEIGLPDDEDLCDGLNLDDIPLDFENSDEIFSCSGTQNKYQFGDAGKDCMLMEKNLSVTGSNGPIENAIQVFSLHNFHLQLAIFNYMSAGYSFHIACLI